MIALLKIKTKAMFPAHLSFWIEIYATVLREFRLIF